MLRPYELDFSRCLILEEIGNGKKFSLARMEFTPRLPDYCSQNTSKEVEAVIEARQEFARMSSLGQLTSCQKCCRLFCLNPSPSLLLLSYVRVYIYI